jgi:bifunctional UDP-N-acetylglucosamine pyrophosphorylase/glucosamine-1-phosphate N-acetyltransferase
MDRWAGVVLAAGQGTRMKSKVPKVLHPICGKALIRYPLEIFRQLGLRRIIIVVSPGNTAAVQALLGDQVEYVIQPPYPDGRPRGSGDALARTAERLQGEAEHLLVHSADVPLVRTETMQRLMDYHLTESDDMTLLTCINTVARDLGRVICDEKGQVIDIIEAADWKSAESPPPYVNSGVYCFSAPWVWPNLERIEPSAKGEQYITSLVPIGAARGAKIQQVITDDPDELLGVNNRLQLAQLEAVQRQRIRERWMLAGVTMTDPDSVFIDADVTIGQDTVILPNTMLLGCTSIGEDCQIGPSSVVRDSKVGPRCRVTASVIEESTMENDVEIGPFSHLRPSAYLEHHIHIGNFAEIKNSRLATGVAMGHFGYVGDASIGAKVNLGAGMVTCNYDGKDKHRTVIESGAFIGCDTMLVAPVTVGAEAITGAGSVVTKDVPPGKVVVGVPARVLEKKPGVS